ncbi:MAG: putative Ig domain-containing protein [Gammaproteobacteria bacterium]
MADDIQLTGSIGDGPVTGATVEVWNSQGQLVGSMKSDNTASFSARMRVKRSHYPLVLKVRGGIDLVTGRAPDFQMTSVVTDRYARRVNINPFSTLIVRIARSLPGGINAGNLRTAKKTVTAVLGFGLDPALVTDPISVRITNENIANLVKSSEAMGEMVRRTRNAMTAAGRRISGDRVMAAIAADLRDGKLNGKGAAGTDPALTAVARVVSGQVLVEALANTLKVGGVVATNVIDQAIVTTRPGIGRGDLTRSVRVTAGMLQQTRNALAAARAVDTSAEVRGLDSIVRGIGAGAMPGDVQNVLPASSSRSLDNAVVLSSTAGTNQVAAVNAAVQRVNENQNGTKVVETVPVATGPETTERVTNESVTVAPASAPVNKAPVISGSPIRSVVAGKAYSFRPTASDADGDLLWFTITGKPSWASFNNWNGRLYGTPGARHARTYRNIAIAVTDGKGTKALPAFSITVTAAPAPAPEPTSASASVPAPAPAPAPINNAPTISGSPARSVVAGTAYSFRPTASDAEGDRLTFSISGKPAWASFSSSNGRLSGTPGAGHVRTYRNIAIAVTDGKGTKVLPAFSITVDPAPVAVGAFTLTWTAPVARADGSPLSLSEIKGYRIHYGSTAGNYPNVFDVRDGSAVKATVNNVPAGTYRVVMTTYDSNGLESANSPVVVKNAR